MSLQHEKPPLDDSEAGVWVLLKVPRGHHQALHTLTDELLFFLQTGFTWTAKKTRMSKGPAHMTPCASTGAAAWFINSAAVLSLTSYSLCAMCEEEEVSRQLPHTACREAT